MIILPNKSLIPEDWSFGSFLRPDLVEQDLAPNFSLDKIEKYNPIPDGRPWIPVAVFFQTFFKEGNGNHRRSIGCRHAEPFLGDDISLFVETFGEQSRVLLALYTFKDKHNNTVIPTMLVRSSMWGKVKEVVLEPMVASGTITHDTKVPLIN